MDAKFTKSNIISSLFWKLLERGGVQVASLIVQIFLARLLLPDDFGTVALVLAFINIAQVFVESGLSSALIQKKDADKLDFSTVFYASLLIAIFFYFLIFITAPNIAEFYENQLLVRILRILALILFPGALNAVQNAFISRNMLFKKLFLISMVSVFISGVAGIVSAYSGLGLWAIVIYYLALQISSSLIMLFTLEWRPTLDFSFKRLQKLFSFGGKLLASSLLYNFYLNLRILVIGRIYSPDVLGYYNRGQSIPATIANGINGSIQAVMFPTLASIQDDKSGLKRFVRRSIKTTSFLVFPAMAGLAVVAEPVVSLILGEKWLPAVPFFQIFCVTAAFQMIHTANLQAISALGRSDIYLKLEIIKKIVGLTIFAISIPWGIHAIALGFAVSVVLEAIIHMFSNKGLYDYSAPEQLRDIMPAFNLSLVMAAVVYLIGFINLNSWQLLLIQIPTGFLVYIALAKLLKVESWNYIVVNVKEMLAKKK